MKRFDQIEVLRFLAALAVFFVHIPGGGYGNFGVDLFFMISGFVIMASTANSQDSFLIKRIIRIAPLYYSLTFVIFFLAYFYPQILVGTVASFEWLIKSILFIPYDRNGQGHYPLLFLGWTLNYEMYFYFLFFIAMKFSVKMRGFYVVVIMTVIFFICEEIDFYPFKAYGDEIVFEFCLGVLIYIFLVEKKYIQSLFILMMLVLPIHRMNGFSDHRIFYYGLPMFFVLTSSIIFLSNINFSRFLIRLGGASYSFYLIHPYVIGIFEKSLGFLSHGVFFYLFCLSISLISTIYISLIIFNKFETPTKNYFTKLIIKR